MNVLGWKTDGSGPALHQLMIPIIWNQALIDLGRAGNISPGQSDTLASTDWQQITPVTATFKSSSCFERSCPQLYKSEPAPKLAAMVASRLGV